MKISKPQHYEGKLSEESLKQRENLERDLRKKYKELSKYSGIERIKELNRIDALETTLAWQGADPKKLPFNELKEHITAAHGVDATLATYNAKIKNRATAIRAYCIWCQGGYRPGIRECASTTCPLWAFRMGKDPIRGLSLPDTINEDTIEDDDDLCLFEDGNEGNDKDASV